MKKAVSLIIALVIALSLTVTGFAQTETNIDGSNWMSAINGEKFITSVNIPGTHDSATKNVYPFNFAASTQNKTIKEQLYSGVRYLDIRLELGRKNKIMAVHEFAKCMDSQGVTAKVLTLNDIVDDCISFLKRNPGEFIYLHVREDAGNAGNELYNQIFEQCISGRENFWFIRNETPVVNEVRGKIVLLRGVDIDNKKFDDTNSGINFSEYPYMSSKAPNEVAYRRIKKISIDRSYTGLFVHDSYKLKANDKKATVKTFYTMPLLNTEYTICALNCIGSGTPHYSSELVNSWFKTYPMTKGTFYGIIPMDFAENDIIEKVYSSNVFVNEPNAPTVNDEEITYSLFGKVFELTRNLIQNIESRFAQRVIAG